MRPFDFSPLYRSTVGFDHLANLFDTVSRTDQKQAGYPPYNIELLSENHYRISMAVAGFVQNELSIESENHTLTITGKKSDSQSNTTFLHRGIATRNFQRKFQLADHVKVKNARLENGLLHIELEREIPDIMKPRKIDIAVNDDMSIEKIN